MSAACYNCLVELLGLVVLLWLIRRRRRIFNSKVATNGCKELANKLGAIVLKQVGLVFELDYPMNKK